MVSQDCPPSSRELTPHPHPSAALFAKLENEGLTPRSMKLLDDDMVMEMGMNMGMEMNMGMGMEKSSRDGHNSNSDG